MSTRYRVYQLVAVVVVLLAVGASVVAFASGAFAGSSTSSSAVSWDSTVAGAWLPIPGENDTPGTHVWIDVTDSSLYGVGLAVHAACGQADGREVTFWTGATVTSSAGGSLDAGAPGCLASSGTGWLLRLWVVNTSSGSTLLTWTSDLERYPVGAGCPSGAPVGMPCVWAANPATTPAACPSGFDTSYPCVEAVNMISAPGPVDLTPVTGAVNNADASMAVGFALVLFLGAWWVISQFRGRS